MFNAHSSSEFQYCDGNLIGTKFAYLHIYVSTGGHCMIMMIAYWLFKLMKSYTLSFMVDL